MWIKDGCCTHNKLVVNWIKHGNRTLGVWI